MPRSIPKCPPIPGRRYFQVDGRIIEFGPEKDIVGTMMSADPDGYWGPLIMIPYPDLPHEICGEDENGDARFPLPPGASADDIADETEYNRQAQEQITLRELHAAAEEAVGAYLSAWRDARRRAHEAALRPVPSDVV